MTDLKALAWRAERWFYGTRRLSSRTKVRILRGWCLLTFGHEWTNFLGTDDPDRLAFCRKCGQDGPEPYVGSGDDD